MGGVIGRKRMGEKWCNYNIKTVWKRGDTGNTDWWGCLEVNENFRRWGPAGMMLLKGCPIEQCILWSVNFPFLCLLITLNRTTLFSTFFSSLYSTSLWLRNNGTTWTWMEAPKTVSQTSIYFSKIVYIRHTAEYQV